MQKITKTKRTGDEVQVENLPSKCKALSSNLIPSLPYLHIVVSKFNLI
jgi:hypothetical protein